MKGLRFKEKYRANLLGTYRDFEQLFFYVLIPSTLITGMTMFYALDQMKSVSRFSYIFHNGKRGGASIQIYEVEGVKSDKIPPKTSVFEEFMRLRDTKKVK